MTFANLTLAEIAVFIVLSDYYSLPVGLNMLEAFARQKWLITPDCISDTVQSLVERDLIVTELMFNSITAYKRQPLDFYRRGQYDSILAIHELCYFNEHHKIYAAYPLKQPTPPKIKTRKPVAQDIPQILALKDNNISPEIISTRLKLALGWVWSIVRNNYSVNADGSLSVNVMPYIGEQS